MISLTKELFLLLSTCEKNICLLDFITEEDMKTLEELENLCLGTFYSEPVYIESFRSGLSKELETIILPNFRIEIAQIELTNKCNLECKFCSEDDVLYRKTGCKKWLTSTKIMNINNWKMIIDQLVKLSCKELTFIGGEPFLEFNTLKEIIEYAFSKNIKKFTVYTNGTLINNEIMNFIKKYNIKIVIQVLSMNSNNFDYISNKKGTYNKVFNFLDEGKNNNIQIYILFLINKYNENEIDQINEMKKYSSNILIEYIYPIPKNNYYSNKLTAQLMNHESKLVRTNLNLFEYLKDNNCCYGNKIAITVDGNILPCIMSRKNILSNIFESSNLYEAFNERYLKLKKLSKDKIKKCKNCAYKYGCIDCSAIEMAATEKVDEVYYCDLIKGMQWKING